MKYTTGPGERLIDCPASGCEERFPGPRPGENVSCPRCSQWVENMGPLPTEMPTPRLMDADALLADLAAWRERELAVGDHDNDTDVRAHSGVRARLLEEVTTHVRRLSGDSR